MRFILILILGLLTVAPLRAAPLDEAIDAWLANDDAVALPALSALANAGDENAMLLLGLLETRVFQGRFLEGLDRKQKIALLRKASGTFGQSWLDTVVKQRALAEAIKASEERSDPAPLLTAGQLHAALRAIMGQMNQDPRSLLTIDAKTRLPDLMRHQVWLAAAYQLSPMIYPAAPGTEEADRAKRALAEAGLPQWQGSLQHLAFQKSVPPDVGIAVSPEDRLLGTILAEGRILAQTSSAFITASEQQRQQALKDAVRILMKSPETLPMRSACAVACPRTASACLETFWTAAAGSSGSIYLHTPLDALISQERYAGSPRYFADISEMARRSFPNGKPDGLDACGAALLLGKQ